MSENTAFKDILNDFIREYSQRDTSVDFSDWLGGKLQKEMDITGEQSEKLVGEIMSGVSGYNDTRKDLDKALEEGYSKEEWFAERMAESSASIPINDAGGKIQQLENGIDASNELLMQGESGTQLSELSDNETTVLEWNEYSFKDKAHAVGKKAAFAGLAAASDALRIKLEGGEDTGIKDAVSEALQDGIKTNSEEVKAAVAGAVKVAAEKGLEKALPEDTPTEFICCAAGAAVESAEALFDAANGQITAVEAMDNVGRAGVAAVCHFGQSMLKGYISEIPVVGPLLTDVLGGLIEHIGGTQFVEDVYAVVKNTVKATWDGIKEFGNKVADKLKTVLFN